MFAGATSRRQKDHEAIVHDLHAKIGELTVERVFFARARELSRAERVQMIDREHQRLSVSRQCRLLAASRSTVYYRPLGENAQTLLQPLRSR